MHLHNIMQILFWWNLEIWPVKSPTYDQLADDGRRIFLNDFAQWQILIINIKVKIRRPGPGQAPGDVYMGGMTRCGAFKIWNPSEIVY